MTTSELNTRVQVQPYSVAQDENGDIDAVMGDAYSKWAKVEQNNGNLLITNGMTDFDESYRITMRYEDSRPTTVSSLINYKSKTLKIYNVERQVEGNAWWEVITAYTKN